MKTIFTILIAITLIQCKGNDACYYEINGIIKQVDGPNEVNVNQNANFDLIVTPTNGCVVFDRFEVSKDGFNWLVRAINKGEDCGCKSPINDFSKTYIFNVNTPGTYNIQFLGDNFQVITKIIEVNP